MSDKREKRFKGLTETQYFRWGVTIIVAGVALLLVYFLISHFSWVKSTLGKLLSILSPFIYGLVMAYLLSPIYNFIIKKTYPIIQKKVEKKTTVLRISKVIASAVSVIILIGVVGGLLALLIPQLIESIRALTATLPERFDQLNVWLDGILSGMGNQGTAESIDHMVSDLQDNLLSWLQDTFLPGVGSFVQRVSTGVILTIRTSFNMLIGVIACVYFLNGKETFKAQANKFILAFFKEERAHRIHDFFVYSNKTFGGFVTGKIIDSAIIGVLCFIVMRIIGLPYPILISTIVGVTNIIPFFGPFIGAIPSLFIIFIVSPVQALYFLILVIVLQQLDGNIIGPAILGNSIGIASFWIMFSIILGGGVFGFIGMVLGVPIFAIIYYYLGRYLDERLEKKGLRQDTTHYVTFDKYDIDTEELIEEIRNEDIETSENVGTYEF